MARNHDDQNAVRQYLLRQLSDDEQRTIEQRLLSEDALFEELEIAEEELIDDYLSSELTPDQRRQFDTVFLVAPERQGKLRFARALRRHPAVLPVELTWTERIRLAWNSQTTLLRPAAVAAAVVIIAGAFWLARPLLNPSQTFATVTLTISNGTRAEGAPATKVKLPLLRKLQLKLPERMSGATRYRVELLGENGETRALETVSQDDNSVVVEMPASQLARGEYALNVFVIRADGSEQRIRGSYLLTVE